MKDVWLVEWRGQQGNTMCKKLFAREKIAEAFRAEIQAAIDLLDLQGNQATVLLSRQDITE